LLGEAERLSIYQEDITLLLVFDLEGIRQTKHFLAHDVTHEVPGLE